MRQARSDVGVAAARGERVEARPRGEERRRGNWRYVLLVFEETGVFGLFYDEKHALFSDHSRRGCVTFHCGSRHSAGRAGRENSGFGKTLLDFA